MVVKITYQHLVEPKFEKMLIFMRKYENVEIFYLRKYRRNYNYYNKSIIYEYTKI